jgi:hypothetical protein
MFSPGMDYFIPLTITEAYYADVAGKVKAACGMYLVSGVPNCFLNFVF